MYSNVLALGFGRVAINRMIVAMLFAVVPGLGTGSIMCRPAQANDSVLIRATLSTTTTDDDKDQGTCENVALKTADGKITIAHALGNCSVRYDEGTTHVIDLVVDAKKLSLTDAKGFTVQMGGGHDVVADKWKYNAKVVLYFSGDKTLTASHDGCEINLNGKSCDFSESQKSGALSKTQLANVIFVSYTKTEEKEYNVGLDLQVKTADGSIQIAHAKNMANNVTYHIETTHKFDLVIDTPSITQDASMGFKVQVCARFQGYDSWTFNGKVMLIFADKTVLNASQDGIRLSVDTPCTLFPLNS